MPRMQEYRESSIIRFGRDHHWYTLAWMAPLGLFFMIRSYLIHALAPLQIGLLFLAGMFGWTLIEYLLHRFEFHHPNNTKFFAGVSTDLHQAHHKQPGIRDYVSPPFILSTTIYFVFFAFLLVLFRDFTLASVTQAGFSIGFNIYDYVHFATHHSPCKNPVLKLLKKHHMLHHFGDEDRYFGVSVTWWDSVFGTHQPKQPQAK